MTVFPNMVVIVVSAFVVGAGGAGSARATGETSSPVAKSAVVADDVRGWDGEETTPSCAANLAPETLYAGGASERFEFRGRIVEIRRDADGTYFWGRAQRAHHGDKLWLSWSDDGGTSYHKCGKGNSRYVQAPLTGGDNQTIVTNAVDTTTSRTFKVCISADYATRCGPWRYLE